MPSVGAVSQTTDPRRPAQIRYLGRTDIGINLNYPYRLGDNRTFSLADTLELARQAEDYGFDSVYLADAPLGRQTNGAWDQVSLLAALAIATKRVRLATGILQAHHKNPVYLAAALATADALSNGRTVVGVGIGSGSQNLIDREYEATAALRGSTELDGGWLQQHRLRHYEESIEIIRELWRREWVTYQGEIHRFNNVTLGIARPLQTPHPPIVLAQGIFYPSQPGGPVDYRWRPELAGRFVLGRTERIARLADGWTCAIASPSDVRQAWSTIRGACLDQGRAEEDVDSMHRTYVVWVALAKNRETGFETAFRMMNDYHGTGITPEIAERWSIVGNPDDVVAQLNDYVAAGVTSFSLCMTTTEPLGELKALAQNVLPHVKRATN
jgi:coenzyme F420-dependent glucose-6-phosphate dehydrogenase